MQNDEEAKGSNITPEFHPDSEYDNWTIRSYDVKTRYEDIPQWMKMYTESSIDTHEFFKFERFEYNELDDWQKMLLKLYREDLRKVIWYYEDYRVALLKEIMDRRKKEGEQVSGEMERHSVCQIQVEVPAVDNKQSVPCYLMLPSPGDETSPTNSLSPGDLSPSTPVKFKRFGHRSSGRSTNKEETLLVIENHQNKTPDKTVKEAYPTTPPTTPPNHAPISSVDPIEPQVSESPTSFLKGFGNLGNGGCKSSVEGSLEEGFDSLSPKLERMKGFRRRVRGRLHTSLFNNTENIDRTNMIDDFPSPKHVRSASTRHSSIIHDFPSPLLQRSASDRPKNRHSLHSAQLRGYREASISSCNTLGSEDSGFSRDSCKRSSGRIITSPKMKVKSEPGSDNATVIPDGKKERKISKMLSRAASFGRKDKNKVPNKDREQDRGVVSRAARKEGFLAAKNESPAKETAV